MIQNLTAGVRNIQCTGLGCQPELRLELCFFWRKRNLRQLHRLSLLQCGTSSLAKLPQTVIVRMLRDAALRTPVLYGQSALPPFPEHPTPLLQLTFTLYVTYSHWNPPTCISGKTAIQVFLAISIVTQLETQSEVRVVERLL